MCVCVTEIGDWQTPVILPAFLLEEEVGVGWMTSFLRGEPWAVEAGAETLDWTH